MDSLKYRNHFGTATALVVGPACALVLLSPGTEGSNYTDLCQGKIGLHLEPASAASQGCYQPRDFACSDSPDLSVFNVQGDLNTEYILFVVAVDIDPSAGLQGATFSLDYDDGIQVDSWMSCTDDAVFHGDWPASGSGITLSFKDCAGTVPAAQDPEGDATVVLGSLRVMATAAGRLAIGSLDQSERRAQVSSCKDVTTVLGAETFYVSWYQLALGEVGFERHAVALCEQPGIVDDPCLAGWSEWMFTCCIPGTGCASGRALRSGCLCKSAGGLWKRVRCRMICSDEDCLAATPSGRATWGLIKSRY